MFIFGWGRTTIWNVGAVFKQLCSNCHNEEFWVLVRRTTWFTLFFIPVIPYETKWTLICPVCKFGIKLTPAQVKELMPIAELNQLLIQKKISEQEHGARMAALNSKTQAVPEKETVIKTVEAEVREGNARFCGDCGGELLPEGKFCTHCGTKTTV